MMLRPSAINVRTFLSPLYSQRILSTVPIAYWKLNETGVPGVAADSSGNGFNGAYIGGVTLNGLTFLDGSPVPTFNGTTGYVDMLSVGLAAAWNTARGTLLVWIYDTNPTAATLRYGLQFGQSDAAQNTAFYNSSGQHRNSIFKGGQREGNIPRVTDRWRSMLASWNTSGNICQTWTDGVLVTPSAGTLSGAGLLLSALVGRRIDGRFWLGGLAQIGYWDRVLTDGEKGLVTRIEG